MTHPIPYLDVEGKRIDRRCAFFILPLLALLAGCGTVTSPPPVTALPTGPAVVLGEVRYSHSEIRRIQTGATDGKAHLARYLNPVWVVTKTLPQRGFDQPFQIYPPLQVAVIYGRLRYDVLLTQPFRAGSTGIWVISAVVPHSSKGQQVTAGSHARRRVIRVAHSTSQILRIQAGADRGDAKDTFYRNPIQVVVHNLQHFGFHGPFRIMPKLTMLVLRRLESYDVTLKQPARKGPTGIWLVSAIQMHNARAEEGD